MLSLILATVVAAAPPASAQPACSPATQFAGTICTPATSTTSKHPAILLLGGSEGGDMMKNVAPVFANAGYVAVSVSYFRAPGLPQQLAQIPVETVGKALNAVAARSDVDPGRIAIMGVSKGGELALLAASTYAQIHAVVADVASPFAWQGIPQGPQPVGSSWTRDGKEVPYVHYGSTMGAINMDAYMNHKPLTLRQGYEASAKEHASEISAAMFAVQKIAGPVLLVAADDDGVWNSAAQSELAMKVLHDARHPYADTYVHYAGAGHLFLFAAADREMNQVNFGPLVLNMGGTLQADLAAQREAWPKIMSFLSTALK